jgi:hypothetical protein
MLKTGSLGTKKSLLGNLITSSERSEAYLLLAGTSLCRVGVAG